MAVAPKLYTTSYSPSWPWLFYQFTAILPYCYQFLPIDCEWFMILTLLALLTYVNIVWYRVLPQGENQFLFAVRVGCVVVWPIFSTYKMKAFCIYFYQGNITFKNIINLVSFIINLGDYLVINSYSVTVLDNFRKETSDRAKIYPFLEVFNSLTFILGNPPPPPWSAILDKGLMKVSLWHFELPLFFLPHLYR